MADLIFTYKMIFGHCYWTQRAWLFCAKKQSDIVTRCNRFKITFSHI